MDFQRLFDIPRYQQAKYPQAVALAYRRQGVWAKYSTEKCLGHLDQLSAGLRRHGLRAGDRAGILAHCGSPMWVLMDLALQQIGVVVVPLHATIQPDDLSFILEDAGMKCCIVSNADLLAKVRTADASLPVFAFKKLPGTTHTKDLVVAPAANEHAELQALREKISPEDLATIIYTSGTTGQPKGVCLTHRNIVSNVKSIMTLVPVSHRLDALSFLPLSHVFERMVTYLYLAAGTSVWYSEDPAHLLTDAQEVRPHLFTAVPRILEKLHALALENARQQGKWGRKISRWAMTVGERYDPLEKLSPVIWLRDQLLSLVVYRRWRKALGGRVQGIVVGAAALPPKLNRLCCAAGLPVREGYGLTECSPVVAFNHFEPGLYRFGTVGIPVPGVEVKIDAPDAAGEGEILVRGPNVMQGYLRRPDETAAVLDADGWLRTGDVGKFVERRFLQVTDRKRDIFKTSSGKFVAPQKIEQHLRSSPYVSQAMVTGLNQPHPGALLVPDHALLRAWCAEHGVHWTAPQYMVLNPRVVQFFEQILAQLNDSLEPHEQVRSFVLLHEEWTVERGELTLTLKLDRRAIAGKFAKEIEGMYAV